MLDKTLIETQLTNWLINFVEQPVAALNGWPVCPYARQARVDNKIALVFADSTELLSVVEESLAQLEHKDVVVICFDHTQIDAAVLAENVVQWNQSLMQLNYVILEDHPDTPEILNGLTMNFGFCGLLVLSELNKLNDAADRIRAKGYYDTWPQENIDNVVTWRYQ